MRRSFSRYRTCVFVLTALHAAALAAQPAALAPPRMYDARFDLASAPSGLRARVAAASSAAAVEELQRTRKVIAAERARLIGEMPALAVTLAAETGAPAMVVNRAGQLTEAAPNASSEEIVRGFLMRHSDLFGLSAADLEDLVVLGDSPGGSSGLRMLRMEQRIDGRSVFQSETRFLINREGRLVKTLGLMVPHARLAAAGGQSGRFGAEEAVASLLASVGVPVHAGALASDREEEGWTRIRSASAAVTGETSVRPVYFPLAPGLLVPAWAVVVSTPADDWYAVVDEVSGAILWRKSTRDFASAHDARFRVFVQADGTTPADSPAPQSPTAAAVGAGTQFPFVAPAIVSMHTAMSAFASANGWINDCPGGGCTANETQTLGNNVLACLDRTVGGAPNDTNICDTDANSVLDGNGRPTGNPDVNGRNRDFLGTAPRDFQTNFLPPPQTTAADAEVGQTPTGNGAAQTIFRRGSVTQQFYVANWYHDQLYLLGFDEGAGNFQAINLTPIGGVGGDRVLLDVQDGAGTDNANFSTPPDGASGRAQMFLFTGPTVDRDGGIDAEVLIHELTHGTSNRIVGNAAGLNWDTARGMGEGWSDFYGLSLLNNTNADGPNAKYASGAYATYKAFGVLTYLDNYVYGIRRFPYTTDNTINPLTWADVDDVTNNLSGGIAADPLGFNFGGAAEVHLIGEIWALSLWEVRSRVIADPAGANGDVPTGNHTMLQLVTDGLRMTPVNPTFLDGRDALLDADCETNDCDNELSIWQGFADRGLGYGAVEPFNTMGRYTRSHVAVGESFSLPYLDVVNPSADVTIDDAGSNNNGAIDPDETVFLTVKLTNPWRGAAATGTIATLTTATAGVTILDNLAVYPVIPLRGSAVGDTFAISVSPAVPCGSRLFFTISTQSSLGNTQVQFQIRVGAANGTDPVVTYTSNPNPDLVIQDNRTRGVFSQINIADDRQIADLDFRIDAATNTRIADLSFMLRSPRGIGTDFISLIGRVAGDCGASGVITNMVVDDDIPNSAANDMTQATNAASPYTKSWRPVFNGPWAALVDPQTPADPVPNLSRFDGQSTLGIWSGLASDNFSFTSGCTSGAGTLGAWSMLVTPVHFTCAANGLKPFDLFLDGNGVLEMNETAVLNMTWLNFTATNEPGVTSGTTSFTGPAGPTYTNPDSSATYGDMAVGSFVGCGPDPCYTVNIAPFFRPAFHWDASIHEVLSTGDNKFWNLHVGGTFNDAPVGSTFYTPIETMIHKGISPNGCLSGNYCPRDVVSRQMLALLMVRTLGLPTAACASTFPDVLPANPFCSAVEAAATRDIVNACGGANFCPTASVSREQAAVFILRSLEDPGYTPPSCGAGPAPYTDVALASPYCPWIKELKARNFARTCDGGTKYCPGGALTRDAFAAMLTRAHQLKLYAP